MTEIHWWPVTIIKTRYGGVYEGGQWAAFNLDTEQVPPAVTGDDITCAHWWGQFGVGVGLGSTPSEAYEDFKEKRLVVKSLWDEEHQQRVIRLASPEARLLSDLQKEPS